MTRSKFDKRLGNILSRRNMVSEDELARHLETAESESRSLTQVLLEGDQLGEADLLEVLSEETRFPAVDVFKVRPEKSVVPAAIECSDCCSRLDSTFGFGITVVLKPSVAMADALWNAVIGAATRQVWSW